MLKFEPKISGTRVTDFDIAPIFTSQFVWLSDVMQIIHKQETMDFILDTFRFTKGCADKEHDWCSILDWDTIFKITVLERYPQYEEEFKEYFGESWLKQYIRFNH